MSIAICTTLFVGVMTIATFFDLEISIAIGSATSFFGKFFADIGEFPSWITLPIAGVILYQAVNKDNKYCAWLKGVFLFVTLAGFLLLFRWINKRLFKDLEWEYLYICLFAVIGTWLSIVSTNHIDKQIMSKLVVFALFMLICVAISQGIVTLLKAVWGRQRFRNLEVGNIPLGSSKGFTPWYLPAFFVPNVANYFPDMAGMSESGAFKSFPSGHTAAAGMSFCIVMLPELFDKFKNYKIWFYVAPTIYTVLVAVSRIVNRAHYLSDVTFSFGMMILIVFLTKAIIFKIQKKLDNKPNNIFAKMFGSIQR